MACLQTEYYCHSREQLEHVYKQYNFAKGCELEAHICSSLGIGYHLGTLQQLFHANLELMWPWQYAIL